MESLLLDLPLKLASALMALAAILMSCGGGGGKGPPSAPAAQLAFDFMEMKRGPQREYARATPHLSRALLKASRKKGTRTYEV